MINNLITGVIPTKTKPVIFSVPKNNFLFSLLTDSTSMHPLQSEKIEIPVSDSFIYGKTHENQSIAIYYGNSNLSFRQKNSLSTSAYVKSSSNISNQDISTFRAISFKGGTLNSVCNLSSLYTKSEENKATLEFNDNKLTYSFQTDDGTINVQLSSMRNESWNLNGNFQCATNIVLTLEFEKEQQLSKVFDYYNRAKNLLSFLTFRHNVGFDEIFISNADKESKPKKIADVYILQTETLTTKKSVLNLHFNDLIDELPILTKLFFETNTDKIFSIGFYPKNDNDVYLMSNFKLREICTSLEYELNFDTDINIVENAILKELAQKTKDCIKNFRKEKAGLSNDTYNNIFSDIDKWSCTLTERLCALYDKYQEEMLILNQSSIIIDENLIHEFVKYRNNTTHGAHRILGTETATAAHYLSGLVYCCVLNRIGVSRERIKNFCEYKLLK